MSNKYVDALNTLIFQATWWLTFLHVTWIVGHVIDLGSDFALGAYYNSIGKIAYCYWTIGFAMVASILNIFVTLFGIRQVPMLSGGENDAIKSAVGRRVVKFVVLVATVLMCGPVVMYVVFMIDLYKDIIDHKTEVILNRTNWIQCIISLLIEQVPQSLLNMYILGRSDKVSAAQLFSILTSTIGAACTFAGFMDTLARNKKGFFYLMTGKGLKSDRVRIQPEIQKKKSSDGKKQRNKLKLKTVKPDNTPGYNCLVFLGLLVFLYILPIALLSAQFDLSPFVMLLLHGVPVFFMVASKLFGIKNKEWIYTTLALTYVSIVIVSTVWYGKVSNGWLGGNKFVNTTMTTTALPTNEPGETEINAFKSTIASIGSLWTRDVATLTDSSLVVFLFILLFSSFCFILGLITCSFTPNPFRKSEGAEVVIDQNGAEVVTDQNFGPTEEFEQKDSHGKRWLRKEVEDLKVQVATLTERMKSVESILQEGKGDEDGVVVQVS